MDAKAVLERLKAAANAKTDAELAAGLGAPVETLSSWKRRNSIPLDSLVNASERYALSLDWLVFGSQRGNAELPTGVWSETQIQEGAAALRCALSTLSIGKNQEQDVTDLWLHWRAIVATTRAQLVANHGLSDEEAIRLFAERWDASFGDAPPKPVKVTG